MNTQEFNNDLDKCVEHLKEELSQLRTGRVTTELIEGVKVSAYDTVAPLTHYGNISVADVRSLTVQVWDKSIIDSIVKGIHDANLGLTASIEGDMVRVHVPDLTEERRRDLVKVMSDRVETARVAVRNVRQKYMKLVEDEVKGGLSEDEGKRQKQAIEDAVKTTNAEIEEIKKAKEADLMTV